MKIIGLTGSIATGKSTVAKILRDKGIPVICADEIVRGLYGDQSQNNCTGYRPVAPTLMDQIKKIFGADYFDADGTLNRTKLGGLIFADEKARAKLDALIHPEVRREMQNQIKRCRDEEHKLIVLDIPLLYESGLESLCEKVIVVYTPLKETQKRLMARNNLSEKEALLRLSAQMSIEEKKLKADFVIDNSGDVQNTLRQVEKLLGDLLG